MTLETGNYIADINLDGSDNVTYPEDDVAVSELDDQIRQAKQFLYNTFPNMIYFTNARAFDLDALYGVAQNLAVALKGETTSTDIAVAARTGSPATDYAVTTGESIGSISSGFRVTFMTPNDGVNCAATPTCTVDSVAAKTIVKQDGTAIGAGDIVADMLLELVYDGTNFRVISAL